EVASGIAPVKDVNAPSLSVTVWAVATPLVITTFHIFRLTPVMPVMAVLSPAAATESAALSGVIISFSSWPYHEYLRQILSDCRGFERRRRTADGSGTGCSIFLYDHLSLCPAATIVVMVQEIILVLIVL